MRKGRRRRSSATSSSRIRKKEKGVEKLEDEYDE